MKNKKKKNVNFKSMNDVVFVNENFGANDLEIKTIFCLKIDFLTHCKGVNPQVDNINPFVDI